MGLAVASVLHTLRFRRRTRFEQPEPQVGLESLEMER
jgi:hypothetical protein